MITGDADIAIHWSQMTETSSWIQKPGYKDQHLDGQNLRFSITRISLYLPSEYLACSQSNVLVSLTRSQR
jgi:hypothetical protein